MAKRALSSSESDVVTSESESTSAVEDPGDLVLGSLPSAAPSGPCRAPCRGNIPSRLDMIKYLLLPEFVRKLRGMDLKRPYLAAVEYFAGVASITFGFRHFGYACEAYDVAHDDSMDFNTSAGFLKALALLLVTVPGGFIWCAPPCSSWVFLSVSSTGRSCSQPLGNETNDRVHWNNNLVHKLCMFLELASFLGMTWAIEQPTSSTLWRHPRVIDLLHKHKKERIDILTTHTVMGMFGGDSQKGMKLYGTAPWLLRCLPRESLPCCLLPLACSCIIWVGLLVYPFPGCAG